MKVLINSNIYLKAEDVNANRDLKTMIRKKYSFRNSKSFKDKIDFRTIFTKVEKNGKEYYVLPPNLQYFMDEIVVEFPDIDFQISDKRVAPEVCNFSSNITPRENQIPILEDIKNSGYNAIVAATTGFGKTTCSLYITEILKTNMLFIASRTSLIQNLLKDVNQFGIDLNDVCEINAEWLKNPIIKPVMYATIQALSDEILKELFDKVGLLVADEIHLGIGGLENVERLFSINPKYRLYLSATYKNLNYIGLNEALLSSTIITSEENISHTIEVDCYHIQRDKTMMNEYKNEHTSYGKKQIIYDEIYCQAISEMVFYMVKKENRGVLVYVESQEAQAEISNMLKMYALKVGILNSNTKKSESEHIINNFDKGDYDVIVAGNSISAGVSLYRLSIIINCNITTNENNLTQLIGRMKRFNPEICDKQKKYIQICIKDMSSSKWKFDKKCLEKFEYIKFGVDTTIDYTEEIYYNMMNEYKRR